MIKIGDIVKINDITSEAKVIDIRDGLMLLLFKDGSKICYKIDDKIKVENMQLEFEL